MATKTDNYQLVLGAVHKQADHIMAGEYKVKPEILFVHYLSGTKANPYSLRRSTVRVAEKTGLNKIAASVKNDLKYRKLDLQDLHDVVLNDYIKHLDRDHTLLNFALNVLTHKQIDEKLYIGSFAIVRRSDNKRQFYSQSRGPDTRSGIHHFFHRELTGPAAPMLVHQQCTDAFFRWLYTEACNRLRWQKPGLRHAAGGVFEGREEDWTNRFLLSRADLYGRCITERERNAQCKANWHIELKVRLDLWHELAALQSALLYFKAGNDEREEYSCSVVIKTARAQQSKTTRDDDQPITLAVAIVSPAISDNEAMTNIGPHLESLIALAEQREADDSQPYDAIISGIEGVNAPEKAGFDRDKFEQGLATSVNVPPAFSDQINLHASWALLLAKQLQLEWGIHEGRTLNFYLVCGERSEFEDHKNTKLRYFKSASKDDVQSAEDLARLAVPRIPATVPSKDRPGFVVEKASHAAKLLSHEHYPWFERGRHALLWDVGSKSSGKPIGVVSLKNANWNLVIDDRLRGQTSTELPNCTIAYVSAEQKCAGVVVVQSRTGKVTEIYRWRNDKWQFVEEEQRKCHLENWLRDALGRENKEMISETSSVVIRVADDPNKGGTLLFVGKDKEFLLKEMGTPWSLNDRLDEDDLVALIGHDGATIRRMNKEEWQHRRLLTPSPQQARDLLRLEEKVRCGNPPVEWPLECKGSRRWSAAMMAFHPDVKAVIVISQDGDIHFWKVSRINQRGKVGLRVFMAELTVRGEMRTRINHTLP